jgi:malonate transporter MadL subunit
MVIYGTALLSLCLVLGLIVGEVLGWLAGVEANVGGVGIAMLLLILLTDRLQKSGRLSPPSESGILFWSAVYIPVVVAMAASQNVIAAVEGGIAALVAGVLVVIVSFAMVPLISRAGRPDSEPKDLDPLSQPED